MGENGVKKGLSGLYNPECAKTFRIASVQRQKPYVLAEPLF